MRLLFVLGTLGLLSLSLAACGGAHKRAGSVSQAATSTTTGGLVATTVARPPLARGHAFRGDEDDDDEESKTLGTTETGDSDNDDDNDYEDNANKGYYDKDDSAVRSFGHAASPAEKRAITVLVKRYYAAAAAGNGAKACSLIYPAFAAVISEEYGQASGPSYLHGGKTCAAVMSLLFKHDRSELTSAVEVTGVRVKGGRVYALLGSATLPAGSLALRHEADVWRIDGLLGVPLP